MNLTDYMLVPYLNRGRTKTGLDCWGLVRMIYRDELGIYLGNLDGYSDSENEEEVGNVIVSESSDNWIETTSPKPLDVVVLRLASKPCHVGVVIGGGDFIHALRGRGVTVGRLSGVLWRNRIHAFYRYAL